MKKTGIMGGTFNPVHYGHLLLAERAYEQFGLDEVRFMPSNHPPHKKGDPVADSSDRSEMIRLAIEGNAHFVFSEEELNRTGNTYTSETLEILTRKEPDTRFYFIIGGDSLEQFESWWRPEVILQLSCVLAAERDGMSVERTVGRIAYLNETYNADVRLLRIPNIEISSHEIRGRLSSGQSIRYLVPDSVRTYIMERGLYIREEESAEPGYGKG